MSSTFFLILSLLLSGTGCAKEEQAAPSTVVLDNGVISAEVALPGARATYRATRFDWSGQVRQVHYGPHTYFGQLVRQNPLASDAISGIAEEYDINGPTSYRAVVDDRFLKLGVGILVSNDEPYKFSRTYGFAVEPSWRTSHNQAQQSVTFQHDWHLNEEVSIRYEKTIRLITNKPAMEITRRLVNLGQQHFETEFYSHQVFCLDGEPVGPGYVIEFGLAPEVEEVSDKSVQWKLENRTLELTSPLEKWFHLRLSGSGPPSANTFRVYHQTTQTAVTVSTDARVANLDFFAEPTGLCPEFFSKITLEPGKQKIWTTHYRFERAAP